MDLSSPQALVISCWAALEEAPAQRGHPFRQVVAATLALDGSPSQRWVVLRAASAAQKRLTVWTDLRSPKWEETARSPLGSALLWDSGRRLQLRLQGRWRQEEDEAVVDAAWRSASASTRSTWAIARGPGSPLPVGQAASEPAPDGRPFFGVLHFEARALDVLWLRRRHVRMQAELDGEGAWQARWVVA
jgi:hypothetical protein